MKNIDTRFRSAHARSLIIALIVLMAFPAAVLARSADKPQSKVERAMNAERQLQAYRHRLAAETQRLKERETLGAPAAVGISIDRTVRTNSTIFFYDNVEGGLNGWTTTAYSGNDLWHQTTLQSSSPTHSWWPGIDLQANYSNGLRVNGAAISPPINLAGALPPVRLVFAENFETEQGWDYCMVDVSSDGGSTWTHLRGGYGAAPSGSSEGWIITTLDLSAYANQTVQLRFYFDTGDDQYNDFPGWFVDDIVVYDQGGTIMGRKFFDVNNNGVKDPGERGVKNWLITATGPVTLTTKTNFRGHYVLPLPLGTYTVSETFQPNWTQTYPSTGTWTINLATADTVVDSIHFGNYIHASFINGMKFNDINKNGVFDGGDTVMGGWRINLYDTLGVLLDYDVTDSLGAYQIYIYTPGTYIIGEAQKKGWVESAPASETYRITIPDLSQNITGQDFGNYYSPNTNAIIGQVYDDRNRNSRLDTLEQGIPGFTIHLYRQTGNNFNGYRQAVSDSAGFYDFLSLPPDTYKVVEVPMEGWWESYPGSYYISILDSGGLLDSMNFGNFQFLPGSVSGLNFHDVNGNGQKDTNDAGLGGWEFLLSGSTYFGETANLSGTSDGSGNYTINGVWPGRYTLSEVWRSQWRQTYPPNLQPHSITVGLEQSITGMDFGNKVDSNFSVAFRTFLPESLALSRDLKGKHLPVKVAPTSDKFCLTLENAETTSVSMLTIVFSNPVTDSLLISKPGTQLINDKHTRFVITFSTPIDSGDDLSLSGMGKKPKLQAVTKWFWTFSNLKKSLTYKGAAFTCNDLLYPMPNGLNVVQYVGGGLRIGLGGGHSVVAATYKDVIKSLIERGDRMHIGDPRCLDFFSGAHPRSIKRQQRSLAPSKHNNKLFAEAIAFKVNIIGSDAGLLPAGFGNLIFDEGTGIDAAHPLNGRPLRTIAAAVDSFLSSYKDTINSPGCTMPLGFAGLSPDTLYAKLRMIDSSFSGRVDTISFYKELALKPVGPLSAVPFLRLDTSSMQRPVVSLVSPGSAIPDRFTLFQNYPNPFNPTTEIDYYLPVQSIVTLKVYNLLGQEVATLVDKQGMEEGSHQYEFSTSAFNLASGVYIYRLVAETMKDEENPAGQTYTSVKKMILMK